MERNGSEVFRGEGPGEGAARAPASPFIAKGGRPALEQEAMRLCREIATAEGVDGEDVMAAASEHRGRSKLNPANMTDDRLLHTLRTLRQRHGALRAPPKVNHLEPAAEWIRSKGGEPAIVGEFVVWWRSNQVNGESEQEGFKRWAGESYQRGAWAILNARILGALKRPSA